VSLISADLRIPLERPDHIRAVTAGNDGSFVFGSVPPGEYRLDAYTDMVWYDAHNPKMIRPSGGRTQRVRVSPGQDANITLQVNAISR
jgi:hypothetical protein